MAMQPPDIDVSNRNQLEAALRDIAQQDGGRDKVIVLAARASMRSIMAIAHPWDGESVKASLLPVFRAVSHAWTAGHYPKHHEDLAKVADLAGDFVDTAIKLAVESNKVELAEVASSARYSADMVIGEPYAAFATDAALTALHAADTRERGVAVWLPVTSSESIKFDLELIQHGDDLLKTKLWPIPSLAHIPYWQSFKEEINNLDEDWDVWTDWYDARLRGGPTHPDLSAAANERIEVARILEIEEEDWKQGPAQVNAKIKAIIERETERDLRERNQKPANEDIPEPKPASVGVIWRDGKAYLDTSTLSADVAAKLADEEKQALCNEIRELIDAIADDVNYDITPRSYLEKTLGMFPAGAPTSAELLKLARRETTLNEFAASVNAEWPDFQAAHFRSVVSGLSAYLNLFPLRRERRRIDIAGVLEDVTGKEARQDIERTAGVMRTEAAAKIIDGSVPDTVDRVAQEIPDTEEPLEGAAREAAVDAYDGINNTAIVIAKNADESTNALAVLAEIGAETPEEAEAFLRGRSEQRLQNFEKLGRAEGNVETGYQVSSGIARNRKELFGWIKRLMKNWGR